MIASNNLFVKGLTRFLPNGRVFGVGGRNDNAKRLSRKRKFAISCVSTLSSRSDFLNFY